MLDRVDRERSSRCFTRNFAAIENLGNPPLRPSRTTTLIIVTLKVDR